MGGRKKEVGSSSHSAEMGICRGEEEEDKGGGEEEARIVPSDHLVLDLVAIARRGAVAGRLAVLACGERRVQ